MPVCKLAHSSAFLYLPPKRGPGCLEKDDSGAAAGRCLLSCEHLVPETKEVLTGATEAGERTEAPARRSIHWPNWGQSGHQNMEKVVD